MKLLNNKFVRVLSTAAVAVSAAALLSVGAFAAEADINDPTIAGYLPPQEQMVQGDIALHSGDVAVGEVDPSFGGYGAPEGDAIQGDIMLISLGGDEAQASSTAQYTVKGLFGKQVLFTARQNGRVLTLAAPEDVATFRITVGDAKKLMEQGVSTVVLTTNKTSTTLNLTLLCEGQKDTDRVVLRHLGDTASLTVGLRCRRDLLIGR